MVIALRDNYETPSHDLQPQPAGRGPPGSATDAVADVGGLVLVPLRPTVSRRLVLTGPANRPWHPAVNALVESIAGKK
jgi:hypothetical protein